MGDLLSIGGSKAWRGLLLLGKGRVTEKAQLYSGPQCLSKPELEPGQQRFTICYSSAHQTYKQKQAREGKRTSKKTHESIGVQETSKVKGESIEQSLWHPQPKLRLHVRTLRKYPKSNVGMIKTSLTLD
jgi:hypothetical protein